MKYDKHMDADCIALCDELNSLKGIRTVESCCGHLKNNYVIFMLVNNFYSLAVLGRTFDTRYSNGKWRLEIQTEDNEHKHFPTLCIKLYRTEIFNSDQEMANELKSIIEKIQHWKQRKFKKHLTGK